LSLLARHTDHTRATHDCWRVTALAERPVEEALTDIIAPIQIKPGFKDQFIASVTEDAPHSVRDKAGCLRFDVIQDANDTNRIWLYEVYKDEAAFQAHTQAPHFLKFRDTTRDWRGEGPQGAGRGASNIWPPDSQWK
jgi:(4S)-4-hydroxy-5-phosphonooxypentane-2,3-dione isomerase